MKQNNLLKTLFLLCVMIVGSASAWADDVTFTMSSIFDGSNQLATVTTPVGATISTNANAGNAKDGKLGSDGNYFQIILSSNTFTAVSFNGYINTTNTSKNWAFQFSTDGGTTWSTEVTQANDGNKTAHDITVGVTIPSDANGFRVIRRAGTSTIVNSITLTLASSTPATAYTVTFDAGTNGTCQTASLTEESAGAGVILPAVTANSGFAFNGWFTAATDGTKIGVAGDTYKPTDDVTVYAQYAELAAPTIITQPEDVTVGQGETATFTVEATGAPEPAYQWYSNTINSNQGGMAIEGAESESYSPSTSETGELFFYVVVTNSQGSVISDVAKLKVTAADQVLFSANATAAWSVPASTTDAEITSSYATITGGSMYVSNGQTSAKNLIVSNNNFSFCMTNTNTYYKIELNEALQVGDIISTITGTKKGYGVRIYTSAGEANNYPSTDYISLTTSSDGFVSTTYTVSSSDTYLIGATTIYLYRATGNSTYFDEFTVTRPAPTAPEITTQPANTTAASETTASFTVAATGTAVNFQWYSCDDADKSNATLINGATTATYEFTAPAYVSNGSNTYYYYVVVSNSEGSETSNVATLTVTSPQVATPVIDPVDGSIFTESSQLVTITCSTESANIQYSTDGTTWINYTEPFSITETTTIQAKASKGGLVESEVVSATITKITLDEAVSVSKKTTWDWTDLAGVFTATSSGGIELTAATTPALATEFVLSNLAKWGTFTINYPSTFNAQALIFQNIQYPVRTQSNLTFAQGSGTIKFNTTVPGVVAVTFTTTGSSNTGRYIKVNETAGSIEATMDQQTEEFEVSSGTVTVTTESAGIRYCKIVFTPAVTATIAASGYTTLSSAYPLDFTVLDDNLEAAYVVSELTATSAKFTQVTTAVPAETGLVLQGTAGATVTIPVAASADPLTMTNKLKACVNGGTVASGTVYALSGGEFKLYKSDTEQTLELPAGKAYLLASDVPGNAPTLSFDFGGDVTGISTIDNGRQTTDNRWYDLSGRRVENPKKGMYIHNGKKVIVK